MSKIPQKKAHHVVPNSTGGWNVKKAGVIKPISSFSKQNDAIDAARKVSMNQKTTMYIHRRDGSIRESHSYTLPCETKDDK